MATLLHVRNLLSPTPYEALLLASHQSRLYAAAEALGLTTTAAIDPDDKTMTVRATGPAPVVLDLCAEAELNGAAQGIDHVRAATPAEKALLLKFTSQLAIKDPDGSTTNDQPPNRHEDAA